MASFKFFIPIMLLSACLANDAVYDLVLLNTTSALCLDGSPGAYYISKDGDPSKIYLEFQGGGWCGSKDLPSTIQSCYGRSKSALGSSKNYTTPRIINAGLLSIDQGNNFKDWKRVLFMYCDGSGHQGTKKEPLTYKDAKLYFRGQNITVQTLNSLQQKIGIFSKASQVVVGGDSAGGLAVFLWTNYIAQHVKNGKVWALPDSGIFLDSDSFTQKRPLYKQSFANLMKISNVQIDPPVPQCVQKFPNARQNCMFAQNIFRYIKVPMFAIESLYDTWSIANILRIPCIVNASLSNCTSSQRTVIEEYRKNVTNILFQIGSNTQNGFWAPACADHVYGTSNPRYFGPDFRIPQHSQNSASKSVDGWINKNTVSHRYIDMESWPSNKPCSGVTSDLLNMKRFKQLKEQFKSHFF